MCVWCLCVSVSVCYVCFSFVSVFLVVVVVGVCGCGDGFSKHCLRSKMRLARLSNDFANLLIIK